MIGSDCVVPTLDDLHRVMYNNTTVKPSDFTVHTCSCQIWTNLQHSCGTQVLKFVQICLQMYQNLDALLSCKGRRDCCFYYAKEKVHLNCFQLGRVMWAFLPWPSELLRKLWEALLFSGNCLTAAPGTAPLPGVVKGLSQTLFWLWRRSKNSEIHHNFLRDFDIQHSIRESLCLSSFWA